MKRKAILYTVFSALLTLPLFLFLRKDCNIYISIVAILQTFVAIRLIIKSGYKFFSLPVLFILFTAIFHFGEALLLAMNRYDLFTYTNIDLAGSMEIYNKANIFALFVQSFTVVGILLSCERPLNMIKNPPNQEDEMKVLSRTFNIGIILFIVGFVPTFMNYYSQVAEILNGGIYAGIRESVDYGPFMLFANFYHPGIILMLLGSKEKKKRAKIIFVLAILFEIFFMISGNRAPQILKIITYFFVYYQIIKKISFKGIVSYIFMGYLGLILLYFISAYRNFDMGEISLLKERFIELTSGEPVLELLAQLGSNLNVVVLAFVSIPKYHHYNYGLTYIISWLAVYPNTGSLLGDIPEMYAFLNYLNTDLPLGGSYTGELYFNFGWFGIIFSVLVGIFIGKVSVRIEKVIKEKNWIKLGTYMVLFYSLLWWVRDYFSGWIFRTFWTYIAIWAINSFLKNRKRR